MTFLEAALEILRRERKPLHYKDITGKAMDKKLLTFVGRTPEVTMQTQLTAAVKKAPGNPFVRVKPGTFGLLRYPEAPIEVPEEKAEAPAGESAEAEASEGGGESRGRRRRRGGRGRGGRRDERETNSTSEAPRKALAGASEGESMADEDEGLGSEGPEEPEVGTLSPEARAAALAESGVLEALGDDDEGEEDDELEDDASAATGSDEDDDADDDDDDADDDDDDSDEEDDDEDDEDEEEDDEEEAAAAATSPTPGGAEGAAETLARGAADAAEDDDEDEEESAPGAGGVGEGGDRPAESGGFRAEGGAGSFEDAPGGRRRRRRRRRRGGGGDVAFGNGGGDYATNGAPAPEAASAEPGAGESAAAGGSSEGAAENAEPSGGRRIMSPVDAAIEILRGQAPGRGMHVRQLADAATRRRLVHGESNEAWRVMRAALAAEPRERLRAGQRPRIRSAGSGLFALSRRPPDLDLERSEHVFGEARRALRERTLAALEQRLVELAPSGFEAIARVLLQREGFGPATFVKRVEGTVYLEALRGRGIRPSRCLIALRPGGSAAGRRAVGELRAGIRARNQDEGVLLLAARLAEDGIAEWKQPGSPIEVADGAALAETCLRHGVGVINAMVSVDFVDADFFAELQEG